MNSKQTHSQKHFEDATLALSGYSSHQGRVLAELYGSRLQPDVVVVYFGWNDHWLAFGTVDSGKNIRIPKTPLSKTVSFIYRNMRTFQLVKRGLDRIRKADVPLKEVRVPIDQYRKNLMRISEIFRGINVPVIFITAPTSFYRFGVPDFYIYENKAASIRTFDAQGI